MLMPIRDFVHTALVEIAEGINDANKDIHALGAEYAPFRVRMDRVEQDIKGMQRSWEKWIEWIWAIIGPIIVAIILRKMGWM